MSIVRIGLVLSKDGGVLTNNATNEFWIWVYFGKGNQWQSWIHIKDISRLFLHINEKALSGIYNGVAPTPLSNFDFTKMVSRIRRGVLFLIPVPRLFFRLIFGEMHIILFKSQKVSSEKIQSKGFTFIYENLENTLKIFCSDIWHF